MSVLAATNLGTSIKQNADSIAVRRTQYGPKKGAHVSQYSSSIWSRFVTPLLAPIDNAWNHCTWLNVVVARDTFARQRNCDDLLVIVGEADEPAKMCTNQLFWMGGKRHWSRAIEYDRTAIGRPFGVHSLSESFDIIAERAGNTNETFI